MRNVKTVGKSEHTNLKKDGWIQLLDYGQSEGLFPRILSMYAACDSLIIFFSRLRSTFGPRQKLMGPCLPLKKAAASSAFTFSKTPLPLTPMILLLSTNVLTKRPIRPAFVMKMPWSVWIRVKPSL